MKFDFSFFPKFEEFEIWVKFGSTKHFLIITISPHGSMVLGLVALLSSSASNYLFKSGIFTFDASVSHKS